MNAHTEFFLGRFVVGAVFAAAPAAALDRWLGPRPRQRSDRTVARIAIGGRDLGLSAGGLIAVRTGRSVRPWLLVAATAEAVDAVVALTLTRRRGTSIRQTLIAVSGPASLALIGFSLARRSDSEALPRAAN